MVSAQDRALVCVARNEYIYRLNATVADCIPGVLACEASLDSQAKTNENGTKTGQTQFDLSLRESFGSGFSAKAGPRPGMAAPLFYAP